ncbi:MAG: phosphoribosyltransferase family protein, partial [Pseudomonadota bacterium]
MEPKICQVSWEEIVECNTRLVADWDIPDAIIGISRGGVPIAVHLSYLAPLVPMSVVSRVAAKGNNDPFYVFQNDKGERRSRKPREFRIPELYGQPKKILIVDDVATFGGTLEVVSTMVQTLHPHAECSFYCHAVDRKRLRDQRPWIDAETRSFNDIDN